MVRESRVSIEEKPGFDYGAGAPAPLHRWSCTCGMRGMWLLVRDKAVRNGALHETFHEEWAWRSR